MTTNPEDLIAEERGWLDTHPNTHSARRTDVRCLADALEAAEATIARIDTALRGDDRSAPILPNSPARTSHAGAPSTSHAMQTFSSRSRTGSRMAEYLTYREAARRVHRSIRTINRWRRRGMPMGWETRDGKRVRVVTEDTLLAWWRARLQADPAHQYRLRRQRTTPDTPT